MPGLETKYSLNYPVCQLLSWCTEAEYISGTVSKCSITESPQWLCHTMKEGSRLPWSLVFPKHRDHELLSSLRVWRRSRETLLLIFPWGLTCMFSGRHYFRVDRDVGRKHEDAQRSKRKSKNQKEVLLGLSSSLYVDILVKLSGMVEAVSDVSITPPACAWGQYAAMHPAEYMRYEWLPIQEGSWQEDWLGWVSLSLSPAPSPLPSSILVPQWWMAAISSCRWKAQGCVWLSTETAIVIYSPEQEWITFM